MAGKAIQTKERRLRLDMRKKFFTVRVVAVELVAPSLQVFEAGLDGVLSNNV